MVGGRLRTAATMRIVMLVGVLMEGRLLDNIVTTKTFSGANCGSVGLDETNEKIDNPCGQEGSDNGYIETLAKVLHPIVA